MSSLKFQEATLLFMKSGHSIFNSSRFGAISDSWTARYCHGLTSPDLENFT